jgi:hypothetical protein
MQLGMWTYPWDVLDVGLDAATRELRERGGLDRISLATTYHAGHFFQPRSPRRKVYFPEDGTIYFRPNPTRWQDRRVQPKVAAIVGQGDVLAELVAARERTGLAVNCWTVCLHNTRLGLLYPDLCTRNALGDPNHYSLCPSNPAARDYVVTLVADLTHGYRPDVVELETLGFMGFSHGFHHEKDGVGLAPEDDFALALCFCEHCIAAAGRAGVDADSARRTVRGWIEQTASRAIPVVRWPNFVAASPDVLAEHAEVLAYVRWRHAPVTSLVATIRDAAHPASRVHAIDIDDGWLSGSDLGPIALACDGLMLCVYGQPPATIARSVATARTTVGSDRFLGAGLRPFYPEVDGPDVLAAQAEMAQAAGADGINFYNYGLIPAARLDWVGAASAAVRKAFVQRPALP